MTMQKYLKSQSTYDELAKLADFYDDGFYFDFCDVGSYPLVTALIETANLLIDARNVPLGPFLISFANSAVMKNSQKGSTFDNHGHIHDAVRKHCTEP